MALIQLKPETVNRHLSYDKSATLQELKKLIISSHECTRILDFKDILYIQAFSNYSNIFLISGEKVCVSRTLKSILPKLDHTFFRPHKSYITNLRYITHYYKKDGYLVLQSGVRFNVSRANKTEINKLF